MKKCFICGGQWRFLFIGKDYLYKITNKKFRVYACGGCGLRRILPLVAKGVLASYYPANYYSYVAHDQRTFLKSLKKFLIKRQWASVEMYFGLPQTSLGNRRFLDVGCGDGEIVTIMNEGGWKAVGYEIGEEYSFKNNIYKSDDFIKINFHHTFDCIRVWSVIEHVRNPREYLKKISLLLGKNGILYMCFPNNASVNAHLFHQYWYSLDIPRHQFGYNLGNMALLLDQTGFKIVKCSYWDNFFFNSLGYLLSWKFPMFLSLLLNMFYRGDSISLKAVKNETE